MSERLRQLRRTADAVDASATGYGDFTVVDRDNRISISSDAPLTEQRDTFTAGVTRLASESVIRIRANAGTETLETVDQLTYSPGYVGEIGIAIQIPEAPTGDQVVRWGYFGDNDGIRWGWDATSVFIQDIRNGTPGAKIRPADWNGVGRSETVDDVARRVVESLQSGVITRQQLQLYNYGVVGHELIRPGDDGELKPDAIHRFNAGDQTTLSRQNNPIRVEVDNPASEDFDVFVSDRQATIRGEFTATDRPNAEFRTDVSLSGTTWVPLISLRIKPDFDQIPVSLLQFSALQDDPSIVQFRTDAGSTTDADYQPPRNADPAETAIEVDLDPTADVSDGYKRFQRLLPGGGQGSTSQPLGDLPEVDLGLKRDQPVTIFTRRTTGTGGNIEAFNVQWQEGW